MDVRLPDGTIIQGVPDGTTKAQLADKLKRNGYTVPDEWLGAPPDKEAMRSEMVKRELLQSPPVALARGMKDIIDTGAGFLSRLGGKDEQARVRQADAAGRAEFDAATEGTVLPKVARFGGQMSIVGPAVGRMGEAVAKVAPRLGTAIQSGGMTTGASPVGAAAKVGDMAIRSAGGGAGGYVAAGMIDPKQANEGAVVGALLPPVVKAAGEAGRAVGAVGKNALGLSTGVGAEPISQAFKAGQKGNREFLDNMRGNTEITAVLDRARQGLSAMRAQRSDAYRSGMIPIKGDKTVLDLKPIDAAIDDAMKMVSFKGQTKNEAAASAVQRMRDEVNAWRQLDPAEFHTPEGLDALKQKLGAVLESIPFESRSARLAAGKVYTATKQAIEQQAPTYAKVMRDYSQAQDSIREIERALSLGDRAAKDTAMRKLQSLMRNNVQTNYGNRLDLANTLESAGGVSLMPALAGQAMSSATPRSLSGQAGGVATALMSMQNPLMAMALPLQSPRIVGEAMYGLGRMTGGAQSGAQNALTTAGVPPLQIGNANELIQALYRSAPVLGVSR